MFAGRATLRARTFEVYLAPPVENATDWYFQDRSREYHKVPPLFAAS
jgi:hypothetical protein